MHYVHPLYLQRGNCNLDTRLCPVFEWAKIVNKLFTKNKISHMAYSGVKYTRTNVQDAQEHHLIVLNGTDLGVDSPCQNGKDLQRVMSKESNSAAKATITTTVTMLGREGETNSGAGTSEII